MSFDGIFLSRLIKEFDVLKTGRISKIIESGDTDFILTIRANRQNYNLMMSFSSDFARIHLTTKEYTAPINPKSFTMFLRKHIEGYFIENIQTYQSDRIIYFTLQGYNEMQDFNKKILICEVMGRYSNMILVDENYKIIEALKHDGVGEYNRTILPNAIYTFPQTDKINPLLLTSDEINIIVENKRLSNPKDYMNTFNGVSLNLSYPIFNVELHQHQFYKYLHIKSKPATFINFKGSLDFYYHPFDNDVINSYNTLSELLDDFYYKADIQAKVKLKTNDLLTFINRQINKNKKKIDKLNIEKIEANKLDEYKIYGELLLSVENPKEKKKEIELLNYYTNEYITIPLDIKYSIIENSSKYFKKYQKCKTSLQYIDKQIENAKNEIEYFDMLKYQLESANINEALEIQDELVEGKYIFKKNNKPIKKQKPKLLTYILENSTTISVGKNNIQNEYLTHKFAKGNEMWFHIKDGSGSHVVIHKEDPLNEEEIRTAANIAAYYSSMNKSSSVAVDYTKVRNIKKIPGKRNCFVTYTNQKTIYIDPSEEFINNLKVKK